MGYFIEFKDKTTNQKYVCQHKTYDIIKAVEIATEVAKSFREEYSDDPWAVRVKDDDGKTVLLLNSDRVRG